VLGVGRAVSGDYPASSLPLPLRSPSSLSLVLSLSFVTLLGIRWPHIPPSPFVPASYPDFILLTIPRASGFHTRTRTCLCWHSRPLCTNPIAGRRGCDLQSHNPTPSLSLHTRPSAGCADTAASSVLINLVFPAFSPSPTVVILSRSHRAPVTTALGLGASLVFSPSRSIRLLLHTGIPPKDSLIRRLPRRPNDLLVRALVHV